MPCAAEHPSHSSLHTLYADHREWGTNSTAFRTMKSRINTAFRTMKSRINALPARANYDGDAGNRWELGVYHPNSGNWYIRGINNTTPANWGWPGSTAVPQGAAR